MDENNIVEELEQEIELGNNEEETVDVSNLTVDDFYKENARRIKAEKAAELLRKQNRELKAKVPQGEYVTKTELELNKLLDKEPELIEYSEDILQYVKTNNLSVQDAAKLVKLSDKAIENRKKMEQLSVSGGETNATKTSYSLDELEKLSQSEYNKAVARIEKGEAKIK